MTMKIIKNTIIASLLIGCSSLALADSFWNHNGSIMRLHANGNHRVFIYEQPTKKMRQNGVTKGTVLFDGKRIGNQYKGTAHRFLSGCPGEAWQLSYDVKGTVVTETQVVLTGTRELFVKPCKGTGKYVNDRLVFNYLYTQ